MDIIDLLGFFGVFLILLAYFFNVSGRLPVNAASYILLNLAGASIACLASFLIPYWPFVILEGIWALVSLISLIKYLRTR